MDQARSNLSQIGEFGLIERLRAVVGEPPEGEVWVGDDAAVIRAPAGTLLFTTDLLIEGVHFDLELVQPEDLGYKAIAVSASDVAAMGGTPRRAVVGLGVRGAFDSSWLERLYSGMRQCCDELSMAVVGGDVSRSDCLVISVALIGNPAGRRVIERKGARAGDVVAVTGVLGASAAGYRMLRAGRRERSDLIDAHLRPKARVREVEALRRLLPTAMIDVSDGLIADLMHLLRASKVAARLDVGAIPVVEAEIDRDPLDLAMHGGEDYELLFTIPKERFDEAAARVKEATGTQVTQIGLIEEGDPLVRDRQGKTIEAKGWDHFRT